MLGGGFAGDGVEGCGEASADGVGMGLRATVADLGGAVGSAWEAVRLEAILLFLTFGIGLRACSEEETSVEDGRC